MLSEVFTTSFSDVAVDVEPGIELGTPITSVLTFTLGCTSNVSISAPMTVTDLGGEYDATTLTLPVVVTNVLPPATSVSSLQPISLFVPLDEATAATPTETFLLGPGTYTVVVYGRIADDVTHSFLASGEINVLAVRRSI
jgi:hypothetical protein